MRNILSISGLAFFLAVLITTIFILSTASFAVTFTVTNTNNDGPGSLRQAIIDANASMVDPVDEIVFNIPGLPGTIPSDVAFSGEMDITDDVEISGPGADMLTIDAQMVDRIFNIDDGDGGNDIVVSVTGLRLINGLIDTNGDPVNDGGGAIFNIEILSVDSCVFENNENTVNGGAIYNANGATITEVRDSVFSGNVTGMFGDGAGIFNRSNALIESITNSTFTDNTSRQGGAIANLAEIQLIENSTFNSNSGNGGAIINISDGMIDEISNSTFSGNSSEFQGGAITNGGTIGTINTTTFSGNSAGPSGISGGGAISNSDSIEHILNSRFVNNTTLGDRDGGAIINFNGAEIQNIENSTFTNNSTGSDGAAIYNVESTISNISSSTFSGNTASMDGGAIVNISGIITEISNSTFTDNNAFGPGVQRGGAILNNFGTITEITGSTFNDNQADNGAVIWNSGFINSIINSTLDDNFANNGGAIWNSGDINISFTTITNNTANGGDGGGIFEDGASVEIRNSIVAFNRGDNCNVPIATNAAEINNYADDDSCGFGAGDDATIILGDLADNGGPTQTVALLGGNPLDGASPDCDPLDSGGMASGVPLGNDQRFFPRPFGPNCDSGAFENGPSASVSITKITDPPGGTGFVFNTIGFEDLEGCELQGDGGQLTLNHGDSQSCAVPFGNYSITETIPDGQVLNIFCSDLPPDATIDNQLGELSFSIINSQSEVDCLFINVSAETLINVTEEPPGPNCAQGGVKIETGIDTNLNGVLDPEEVINTFFVCNGEPGVQGPVGPPGPGGPPGPPGTPGTLVIVSDEPPGQNCPEGGIKIETGVDTNSNGALDPDEITQTFFVCNGLPGVQGPQGPEGPGGSDGSCSLSSGSETGFISLVQVIALMLVPFLVISGRRLRRAVRGN